MKLFRMTTVIKFLLLAFFVVTCEQADLTKLLNPFNCGMEGRRPTGPASLWGYKGYFCQYPWWVQVLNENDNINCTGLLLTTRIVVVHVSCFRQSTPHGKFYRSVDVTYPADTSPNIIKTRSLLLGDWDINNNHGLRDQEAWYLSLTTGDQITFLMMKEEIENTACARPVCVPDSTKPLEDAVGCWVLAMPNRDQRPVLISPKIVDTNACEMFPEDRHKKKYFCVENDSHGDWVKLSRPPLVCKNPNGRHYIYGFMNRNVPYTFNYNYTFYTHISQYTHWLKEAVQAI